MLISPALVVCINNQQSGIFARGTGVRLEGHCRKAGYLAEVFTKIVDQFGIAFGLIFRYKWMQGTKFGPAEREHFCSSIEFHGTGAEWDHGTVKCKVPVLKLFHVTHHLSL